MTVILFTRWLLLCCGFGSGSLRRLLPLVLRVMPRHTHMSTQVPRCMMQEHLQLLPNLGSLRVRVVTSPGLPRLAAAVVHSLPPTVKYLRYQYGADLNDPPLPRRLLDVVKPPGMSIVQWKTNWEDYEQTNTRHVIAMLYSHPAAAARPAPVCVQVPQGAAESHHGRMHISLPELCATSCGIILAAQF